MDAHGDTRDTETGHDGPPKEGPAVQRTFPIYPARPFSKSGRARITLYRRSVYLPGAWGSEISRDAYDALHKQWRLRQHPSSVTAASAIVLDLTAAFLAAKQALADAGELSIRT